MRLLCFIVALLSAFSLFADYSDTDEDGNEIREIAPGCFITIIRTAGEIVDLNAPVDINGPPSLTEEESLHWPFISNGIDPGPMFRDIRDRNYAGIYIQTIHSLNLIRYENDEHQWVSVRLGNPALAPPAIDFKKYKHGPLVVVLDIVRETDSISPPLKQWLAALNWHVQDSQVQVILLDRTRSHVLARDIAAHLGLLQPDADYELHRIISTSPDHGPK